MKILFLCRGNVGRSQMAEALFKKATTRHEAFSAGTKLSGPEQTIQELSPAADNVIECMREEGIDVSKNVREQLTPQMMDAADRIIFIADDNDPIPDSLLNNEKVVRWNVRDPKGTNLEFHRKVRDEIKEKIGQLVKDIS